MVVLNDVAKKSSEKSSLLGSLGVPIFHLTQTTDISLVAVFSYPWMLHDFIWTETTFWVFDKEFANHVLCLVTDFLKSWRIKIEVYILDLLEKHKVIFIVEWRTSTEQNEKDNSNGPVVTCFGVRQLLKNLRGNIAWSTTCGLSELVFLDSACKSEIRHFNYRNSWVFGREKQILGLDISVYNSQGVAVLDCVHDWHNQLFGFLF